MDKEQWDSYLNVINQKGGGNEGCCPNVLGKLLEHVPTADGQHNYALDVGVGTGGEVDKLQKKGYAVVACDLIPQNEQIIKADMHELPFPNELFDLVLFNQSFEHALAPYIVLCEANRVLKNGGFLAISWPMPCERWLKDAQHYSILTRPHLEALLNRCSFIVEYYNEVSEDGSESVEQQMQILLARKLTAPMRQQIRSVVQ